MSHEPPQPAGPPPPKIISIDALLEEARARARTDGHSIAPVDPPDPDDGEGFDAGEDADAGSETPPAGLWDRIGDVHPGFTYAMTLAILVGFAIQLVTAAVPATNVLTGASLAGPLVTAGASARAPFLAGEWWRLLSSIFLHANLLHVGSNLLALVILGGVAERAFGHSRYLVLFAATAAAGSLASFWHQSRVVTLGSIGASGAVYGIGAAVVVAAFRMRGLLPAWRVRALVGATLPLLLASLAGGFQKPGTDNAAHIGGVLAGALLALVLPFHSKLTDRTEAAPSRAAWGAAGWLALVTLLASGAMAVAHMSNVR